MPRGDDVLRDVARGVRRRAIDLRRILAGERAAAVRRGAAVGVDDDLAAGEAGVAVRAADLEAAGRIHEEPRARQHVLREHRLDDLLDHRLGELLLLLVHARVMLRRQHDGVDATRLAVDVADGDLRLGVGAQPRQAAVAAHFALPLHEPMRVVDRERHQRRRLVARVAEHQPLVARALVQVVVGRAVDALRDVGRLAAVADHDGAAVGVEAQLGVVVADPADRVARDAAHSRRCALVVISPAMTTRPVDTSVSAATRPVGSCSRIASSTASEIWSATLSGWPSDTDSDVNRKFTHCRSSPIATACRAPQKAEF